MIEPGTLYLVVVGLLLVTSLFYWSLASIFVRSWLKDTAHFREGEIPVPSVTFLRPVKRDTPGLTENLASLVQAMQMDDQLVLGVDSASEAETACAALLARFPEHDIVIVACTPGAAVNPKISKLVQMTPRARHEHWILSDSEAVLDMEFLTAFRREWAASKADALTAGYRFVHLGTWSQQLDAAATLLTLWLGLAIVRRFGRVRLTLGACTGFRRGDLDAIGGFAAVGDDLAEDNRLGVLLAGAGRNVRLSAHVVTLASDALSWRDYWRHQRRVAITYRVANPAGFAASIVTHGIPLSLLAIFAPRDAAALVGVVWCLAMWVVRWTLARGTAQELGFPIPRLGRVILFASFVETACWLASWFSRRVWWSGRWWRVNAKGKLAR